MGGDYRPENYPHSSDGQYWRQQHPRNTKKNARPGAATLACRLPAPTPPLPRPRPAVAPPVASPPVTDRRPPWTKRLRCAACSGEPRRPRPPRRLLRGAAPPRTADLAAPPALLPLGASHAISG
uniref:Uncharacterized protein n=1 Tax=Oryza glumipatula TaxID=40148 RepID=A0A0D9Z4D5_9ORYZ